MDIETEKNLLPFLVPKYRQYFDDFFAIQGIVLGPPCAISLGLLIGASLSNHYCQLQLPETPRPYQLSSKAIRASRLLSRSIGVEEGQSENKKSSTINDMQADLSISRQVYCVSPIIVSHDESKTSPYPLKLRCTKSEPQAALGRVVMSYFLPMRQRCW